MVDDCEGRLGQLCGTELEGQQAGTGARRVFKFNGKTGCGPILDEIKNGELGRVTITIARPPVVEVTIVKNGKPFGAAMGHRHDSQSVEIEEIREGALMDYLASAPARLQVSAMDHIISVNGTSGGADKMLHVIKTSSVLTMLVARASKIVA